MCIRDRIRTIQLHGQCLRFMPVVPVLEPELEPDIFIIICFQVELDRKSSSGSIVPMKYSAGSNVPLPWGITVAAFTELGLLFATLRITPPGFNFGVSESVLWIEEESTFTGIFRLRLYNLAAPFKLKSRKYVPSGVLFLTIIEKGKSIESPGPTIPAL